MRYRKIAYLFNVQQDRIYAYSRSVRAGGLIPVFLAPWFGEHCFLLMDSHINIMNLELWRKQVWR